MFWQSSKVTCAVCGVAVPRAQSTRTLEQGFPAVCRTCHERWKRSGMICAKCHTPVRPVQRTGVFSDLHSLGHADCGGALLAA